MPGPTVERRYFLPAVLYALPYSQPAYLYWTTGISAIVSTSGPPSGCCQLNFEKSHLKYRFLFVSFSYNFILLRYFTAITLILTLVFDKTDIMPAFGLSIEFWDTKSFKVSFSFCCIFPKLDFVLMCYNNHSNTYISFHETDSGPPATRYLH